MEDVAKSIPQTPNPREHNYIHPTAIVGPNVEIGKNNHIGPFCLIGSPAEDINTWGKKIGRVSIGDNNIFAGYVAVDAASEPDNYTRIGDNNKFSKFVHVTHDDIILDNETINI